MVFSQLLSVHSKYDLSLDFMENTSLYIALGILIGTFLGYHRLKARRTGIKNQPERPFPSLWRQILSEKVAFYKKLSNSDKREFERKAHVFLLNVPIFGVDTEVKHEDKVLIAAGAVIPIFHFAKWHYANLKEIHLYPDQFSIPNSNEKANGLVGWGAMEGKMFLSKKALHDGFSSTSDQKNVAIHEFVHLLDKQDGRMDGILAHQIDKSDWQPWLQTVRSTMKEINEGQSALRSYGATNDAEFLAVVSEAYFEAPEELQRNHPALYYALDSFYKGNQKEKPTKRFFNRDSGGYRKRF